MARELGVKHVCFKCGTKFYDLCKPEPICPKCGADQRENVGKPTPTASEKKKAKHVEPKKAAAPEEADEELPVAAVAGDEEDEEVDDDAEEDDADAEDEG